MSLTHVKEFMILVRMTQDVYKEEVLSKSMQSVAPIQILRWRNVAFSLISSLFVWLFHTIPDIHRYC